MVKVDGLFIYFFGQVINFGKKLLVVQYELAIAMIGREPAKKTDSDILHCIAIVILCIFSTTTCFHMIFNNSFMMEVFSSRK